ncbi:hypothetical protein CRM22_002887 [Opisthorchis felineus]|uniref:DH domain-containing protein n=1 Tax=Opisthorchis felineus TaxID=147828 RepID=A0A4S2M8E5_OPIFE|nr:hypothetical protein CRM22_002887 [Opisthorchis felineus]
MTDIETLQTNQQRSWDKRVSDRTTIDELGKGCTVTEDRTMDVSGTGELELPASDPAQNSSLGPNVESDAGIGATKPDVLLTADLKNPSDISETRSNEKSSPHVQCEPNETIKSESQQTDSKSHESPSKEQVFQIILEDELPEKKDEGSGDQIYYLPLAIGGASMRSGDGANRDLVSLCELTAEGCSDPLLRELGRSLSQASESDSQLEVGKLQQSRVTDSSNTSADSGSFASKPTLFTDNLSNAGSIPESIAQQFNEIAKLNKNSLRSKRTVRTSTTKITSSTITSPALQDETLVSPSKPRTPLDAKGHHTCRTETSPLSTERLHPLSMTLKHTHPDDRRPMHARFHSDEVKLMNDYSVQSPTSPSRKSDESPVTSSSISGSPASRQPITYVRSVTAERLPIFIRTTGVLRSKSAASTLPHNRQHPVSTDSTVSQPNDFSGSVYSPRSLPESSMHSHSQSSVHIGSNEGSTSSLPSLSTSGSTGPAEPQIETTTHQGIVPTGSDPNLNLGNQQSNGVRQCEGKQHSSRHHEISGSKEREISQDSLSILNKRYHIMKELIKVEKEYVGSLATLVNCYMIPLKQEKILDDQQVDTIFYKVNELLNFHMSFLNTLQMWEITNTVGDKLLDMFSREAVTSCYCSFVEHFPNAEKTVESCWNIRAFQKFCEQKLRTLRSKLPLKALLVQPVQRIPRYELLVRRLIEYTPKEYSDNALLKEAEIAIHQLAVRVNTVQADGQDECLVDGLKLLEQLLAPATLTPSRTYIRHDIISLEDRKDPVCIFTFTDQIVFTIAKRRGSQLIKKPAVLRLPSPKGVDTIENLKYKIFHRLGIEAIEFEAREANDEDQLVQHRELRDKKDLALLAEIEHISGKLEYRHHDLDVVVRQLYQSVQQELEDLRTARYTSSSMPKNLSVFTATMKEGIERYELTFPTHAKRKEWERTVMELKRQLSSVKRTSRFYGALEIPRTLSGIQLSCAAVVEVVPLTKTSPQEVWICAVDGYTGYICLLSLHPKPMINLNVPLSGCNSRITCICAVPGCTHPTSRRLSGNIVGASGHHRMAGEKARLLRQRMTQSKSEDGLDGTAESQSITEQTKSEHPLRQFASKSTDESFTDISSLSSTDTKTEAVMENQPVAEDTTVHHPSAEPTPPDTPTAKESLQVDVDNAGTLSTPHPSDETLFKPDHATSVSSPSPCQVKEQTVNLGSPKTEVDQVEGVATAPVDTAPNDPENPASDASDSSDASEAEQDVQEETSTSSQNTQMNSKSNSDDFPNSTVETETPTRTDKNPRLLDPHRPTMWLGTEEGCIFIFYATDNIKTSRQRQRIDLPSAVNSILHLDVRIFVACVNGDFLVYDRNSDGLWDVDSPRLLKIQPDNEEPIVVRRMLAVAGNIWCAAHRFIYVLNSVTLKVELSFPLNGNPADPRGIQMMAYGNQTVWIATENSPRISLYHATTGEFLMEIDLKPIVLQSLQHCDEIIMRHKEACLRITCMAVCKDLLWVGTSAGVIVTVAIPRVSVNSTQANMEPPQLEVLRQGHIGQVRFLVSLESVTEGEFPKLPERARVTFQPKSLDHSSFEEIPETEKVDNSDEEHTIKVPSLCAPRPQDLTPQQRGVSGNLEIPSRIPTVIRRKELETQAKSDANTLVPPNPRHYLLGVRRASVNPCTTIATQMKVISGGDGYEEYVTSELTPPVITEPTISDSLGDNDALNHVLIWDVH